MIRLSLILTAIMVYVIAIGCSLGPSSAGGGKPSGVVRGPGPTTAGQIVLAKGMPYRAAGMQIQRTDWIDKYKQSVDEIAANGFDTVKFVVDARQENGESSRIYLDMRMCPTPDQLGDLIRYAKQKNLRVMLMPIVLLDAPRGNEWRGQIQPKSWTEWWKSYRDILGHFSWIAQSNGADILVVGSELVSTEDNLNEWTRTIDHVRKTFHGQLTYSANWDHYAHIKFWDQLDFVGMNSYWSLGKNSKASLEEIKGNWKKIQNELFEFQDKVGKPIFFTEVGWASMANMAHEPWDYTKDEDDAPTDNDLQARLYTGFFESWYGSPRLGGFSVWEWTPAPDPGNEKEVQEATRGYTPRGKPAEKLLRDWLAKPWK